jgi:hypothetical protein
MGWAAYTVTVKVRGTTDGRKTAQRRSVVYANNYGEAIEKAQQRLLDSATYEVKKGQS